MGVATLIEEGAWLGCAHGISMQGYTAMISIAVAINRVSVSVLEERGGIS